MDQDKQKILPTGHHNNNIGEAEDRISELPNSLLHCILSFIELKSVAQTSVLSKRWKHIWNSIPTLVFPKEDNSQLPSFTKFIDFVDTTLQLHDSSNIQKFHLDRIKHMSASRVQSWIEILTRHNVEDLSLYLAINDPLFVPLSLFTSEWLIKLDLSASPCSMTVHIPKSFFSCPKLKSLTLGCIEFTEDNCWNDQQFSNCPVLEELHLEDCTWVDAANFCISTPSLKLLNFYAWEDEYDNGLQNCVLKINAPNLVSLTYYGRVAKEYFFSSFQKLKSAEVLFNIVKGVEKSGYVAAASKFIRALSHVQNLSIHGESLKALSIEGDLVSILPTFHDLEKLILREGLTTDKSLFSLLKKVPKLRRLIFEESCIEDNEEQEEEHNWAGHMLTAGYMFQHLESLYIERFCWFARQMRWLKLILKNAKSLRAVILSLRSGDAINKEALVSELISLPKASDRCEFELKDY